MSPGDAMAAVIARRHRDAPTRDRAATSRIRARADRGARGGRVADVATHLASRGYVAAPDFPLSNFGAPGGPTLLDLANQPGDVTAVIDGVLATFGPSVDRERIGLTGLSLGGITTLLTTFHPRLRDARVRAALAIAPGACFFTKRAFRTTKAPLLLLHGDNDLLLPFAENALRAYRRDRPPDALVRVKNGSHLGFTSVASLLDPSTHYDLLGCAVLQDIPNEPLPGLGRGRASTRIPASARSPVRAIRPACRSTALGKPSSRASSRRRSSTQRSGTT
jgi:predicted dienelactone hydrolase